jgi:hypothetical protein
MSRAYRTINFSLLFFALIFAFFSFMSVVQIDDLKGHPWIWANVFVCGLLSAISLVFIGLAAIEKARMQSREGNS